MDGWPAMKTDAGMLLKIMNIKKSMTAIDGWPAMEMGASMLRIIMNIK